MTHPATHDHGFDPPPISLNIGGAAANWPPDHSAMLVEMVKSKEYCFREIRAKINATFETEYTRSAVIGRATRMGLRNERPEKNNIVRAPRLKVVRTSKPKLRVIRSSGNSNKLKLAFSIEGDFRPSSYTPPSGLNVTLADRADDGCTYIAGNDGLYCGQPRQPHSSFCADCHPIVWRKPDDRRQP